MSETAGRPEPSRDIRIAYTLAILACMAAVALLRFDLVAQAWDVTLAQLKQGWGTRLKLIGEIALFTGILAFTLRIIPMAADGARDLVIVFMGTLAGVIVETWGTRTRLWSYYTGEQPPLWIIPAWPLGALVINRISTWADSAWGDRLGGGAYAAGYWILIFGMVWAVTSFLWTGRSTGPGVWLYLIPLAGVLSHRQYRADFWRLAAGALLVFFADLWGVTNQCWAYHTQTGAPAGAARGILFGMALDSITACLVIKTATAARSQVRRALAKPGAQG